MRGKKTITATKKRLYGPKPVSNPSKAIDKGVGDIIPLITLDIPKQVPKKAPPLTPNKIAPIITGICIRVISIIPIFIYPIGKTVINTIIESKRPYCVSFLAESLEIAAFTFAVFAFLLFLFFVVSITRLQKIIYSIIQSFNIFINCS